MNSILVVTAFRNAERSIVQNARRSLDQRYSDYRIVFVDDASTDQSANLLRETIADRAATRCRQVTVEENAERQGPVACVKQAVLSHGRPEDVVVMLDGDDWLAHEDVLAIVNSCYDEEHCWVMYGGAIWKPNGSRAVRSAGYSAGEIADLRLLAQHPLESVAANWMVEPLLTFRQSLFRQVELLDPEFDCLRDSDGRFYQSAADVAIMLPLVELAGARKVHHNRWRVCVFNQHDRSEHGLDARRAPYVAREIFAKPRFPQLVSLDKVANEQPLAPAFVRPAGASVGSGVHTSGWPFARQHLEQVRLAPTVVLDDFVEQTFCYVDSPTVYRRPWVGMFHHPPQVPAFTFPSHALETVFQRPEWRESEKHLVGAITFSNHLAEYLRTMLSVPVKVMKVPVAAARTTWCEKKFLATPTRKLTQLGAYMRNTRAIFQVPPVQGYSKVRLLRTEWWTDDYDARVRSHWESSGERQEFGDVRERGYVQNQEYEQILEVDVVLTEVFAASANNVVVECLVHNTPLVINRHPAVVDYLGPDYPLYFDCIAEVPKLLETDQVIAAHRYLAARDKSDLRGECFTASVEEALRSLT